MYPRTRVATGAAIFFLSVLKLQNPSFYIINSKKKKERMQFMDCNDDELSFEKLQEKVNESMNNLGSKTLYYLSLLLFNVVAFSYYVINYFTDLPFNTTYFIILLSLMAFIIGSELYTLYAIRGNANDIKMSNGVGLDGLIIAFLIVMFINKEE